MVRWSFYWAPEFISAGCQPPTGSILAELPGLLRRRGNKDAHQQCLLTTNYDTVLEETFASRNERFHLFYTRLTAGMWAVSLIATWWARFESWNGRKMFSAPATLRM